MRTGIAYVFAAMFGGAVMMFVPSTFWVVVLFLAYAVTTILFVTGTEREKAKELAKVRRHMARRASNRYDVY